MDKLKNEQVPAGYGTGDAESQVYSTKQAIRDMFTAGYLAGYQFARNNKPESVSADKIIKAARAEFASLQKETTP
jgi:hypothetical protein